MKTLEEDNMKTSEEDNMKTSEIVNLISGLTIIFLTFVVFIEALIEIISSIWGTYILADSLNRIILTELVLTLPGIIVFKISGDINKLSVKQERRHGELVSINSKMDKLRKTECLCLNCDHMQTCTVARKLYTICTSDNMAMSITRCGSGFIQMKQK